jgi:hypothetical protein
VNSTQAYESTVADSSRTWLARFVVIPQRAFGDSSVPTDETAVQEFFGCTILEQLQTASALPRALAVLIAYHEKEQFPRV